jgi:predicted phosphodiesterase
MSHSVTILHLSDLHERGSRELEPWRREAVLGPSWNQNLDELAQTEKIDLVCFTGDLADWGRPEEYEKAAIFLDAILARLKLNRDRFFVVPGNHDIDRMRGTAAAKAWAKLRKSLPSANELAVSRWLAGGKPPLGIKQQWLDKTLIRQNAFRKFLKDFGREKLLPENSAHGRLGYLSTIQLPSLPFPVQIIGLDSSWLCGSDNESGMLRLTDDQIGKLCTNNGVLLPGFRFALVHHPLSDLSDSAGCRRYLSDYVHLLLRGHLHEPEPEIWSDPDRKLLQLASGSLYEGSKANTWPNSCVLIKVQCASDGSPIQYDFLFRGYSTHGHWHNDASLYKNAPAGKLKILPKEPMTNRNVNTSFRIQHDDSLVLFNTYSNESEPYYVIRELDNDIVKTLDSRSVWIFGDSGIGKTCSIQRVISLSKMPSLYITLSTTATGKARDCTMYVCQMIAEHLNYDEKLPSQPAKALGQIRNLLAKHIEKTPLWIYIDEIPLCDKEQISIFTNSMVGILGSSAMPSSALRIFISSIYGPMEHLAETQKRIVERMKFISYPPWSTPEIEQLIQLISAALPTVFSDKEIQSILAVSNLSPRFIKQLYRSKKAYPDCEIKSLIAQTESEFGGFQR